MMKNFFSLTRVCTHHQFSRFLSYRHAAPLRGMGGSNPRHIAAPLRGMDGANPRHIAAPLRGMGGANPCHIACVGRAISCQSNNPIQTHRDRSALLGGAYTLYSGLAGGSYSQIGGARAIRPMGGARAMSQVAADKKEGLIMKSINKDLVIPTNLPLHEYLFTQAALHSNRIALVDGVSGREITYGTLQTMVARVADSLSKMRFSAGSVLTMFCSNSPEYIIIYLSIISLGLTVSTVNPAYTPNELSRALNDVKAEAVITTSDLLPVANQAISQCSTIKSKILLDSGVAQGWRTFDDLLTAGDVSQFSSNQSIDCMTHDLVIPFSSGTTGLPKGVMLTHHNLLSNILQFLTPEVMDYGTSGEGSVIGVLPFYHIYGQIATTLVALSAGLKVVTLPKFDPALYLETVQKHRTTVLHVVPPMMLFLARHPMVDKYDLSSVIDVLTGAAPCGADLIQEVERRLGSKTLIRQGYGLTEASPLTHANSKYGNKHGSVGQVIRNTECKIVDSESGATLGIGQDGEVLVRGPQVMKGYYNNPTATAETIVDGWLRTGDVGHHDEEGYLVIVDRFKELIKVKSLQVAPAELEALLLTHPVVADAGVVGRTDERLGEAPMAFVVLKSGQQPSRQLQEDIRDYVKKRVAPYKQLAGGVVFLKEIPKSPSGKILRRVLKDQINK